MRISALGREKKVIFRYAVKNSNMQDSWKIMEKIMEFDSGKALGTLSMYTFLQSREHALYKFLH